jgi:predicted DCC family thiol-disulfide oxidoreductase YuxK
VLFHLSSLGINLFFTGVFFSWILFFPIHRVFQKVVVLWDGECKFCEKSVLIAKKFDWFNRFIVINSQEKELHREHLEGWDGDIHRGLWAKGVESIESSVGFDGFRRMVWVMPVFWIILPLLYMPFIPTIGRAVYSWIAKNRYRFGCNSEGCKL